jgi:hypothetical protein
VGNSLSLTVDTTAPTKPAIALALDSSNTGFGASTSYNTDLVSNSLRLTVTGSAAGDAVQYRVAGTTTGTAPNAVTTTASNSWLDLNEFNNEVEGLPQGRYTLSARLIDANGNVSGTSDALTVLKDTLVNDLALSLSTDSGNGMAGTATDALTNNPALNVTLSESNAVVQYRIANSDWLSLAQYTAAMATTGLTYGPDGAKTISVRQIDVAGNISNVVQTTFTLDRSEPNTSIVRGELEHLAANDSGSSSTDSITRITTPWLVGAAEAGSRVEISLNNKTYTGDTDAVTGAWRVQVSDALPAGSYTPSIVVKDKAGNASAAVQGTAFTVDTVAPSVAMAASASVSNEK